MPRTTIGEAGLPPPMASAVDTAPPVPNVAADAEPDAGAPILPTQAWLSPISPTSPAEDDDGDAQMPGRSPEAAREEMSRLLGHGAPKAAPVAPPSPVSYASLDPALEARLRFEEDATADPRLRFGPTPSPSFDYEAEMRFIREEDAMAMRHHYDEPGAANSEAGAAAPVERAPSPSVATRLSCSPVSDDI